MTQRPTPRPGEARSEGRSVQDVYASDRYPVPPLLRETASRFAGSDGLTTEAYTSLEFHDREMERMWPRVWQMACREEDIPSVGDYEVYEIGDISLIVVRAEADQIRAYHNSCLHRGTKLCEGSGHLQRLRCPFHNFTWQLDGRLSHVPCQWDFPHVEGESFRLPEAAVECWGGFVFVNPDPAAGDLSTYLENMPEHFTRWPLEERYKAAHVAKVIGCNWKIALEAFLEVFHLAGLHPDSLPVLGDANSQYDIWPDQRHVSRMISLSGVASPHLEGFSEQRVLREASSYFGLDDLAETSIGNQPARGEIAESMRRRLARDLGIDAAKVCDAEVMDVIEYFCFPNFITFGGFGSPLAYRSRPYGRDPHSCIFEVMFLLPLGSGMERPPAAPLRWLADNEPWASVEEFSYFGRILDQDFDMMPRVQAGLRASVKKTATLGNYQEARIRHFRRVLDEYLGT